MPTLPTTPERDWKERFDQFIADTVLQCGTDEVFITEGYWFYDELKQFISTELQAQATELLGEVEKILKAKKLPVPNPYGTTVKVTRYNQVFDEAIRQLASLRSKWEK